MSRGFKWALIALGILAFPLLFGPLGVFAAIVVGTVAGGAKLYRRWAGTAATPGGAALSFGLVGHAVTVGLTMLTFLLVPPGSYGRPMALATFYFVFALVMAPLGIWKARRAWSQERPLAVSAVIVSLAILPVTLLTFLTMAIATAYEMEP